MDGSVLQFAAIMKKLNKGEINLIKILCLDNGMEYYFVASSEYEAMQKMLYTLNVSNKDNNAKIELCNGRTWSLQHNGKTYACVM